MKQIDESIARYLGQIASADRVELSTTKFRHEHLGKKINKLKKEVEQLNKIQVQLKGIPDKQISLADPDARSMATSRPTLLRYLKQSATVFAGEKP